MGIELAIAVVILFVLTFLATIDMAFSQLSDVGLRRISTDWEENKQIRSSDFLHEILENRPRFRFALSTMIQVLLICFSVLSTSMILNLGFPYTQALFFALAVGLIASIIFRQIIPRSLTWKTPEGKLLFLLPVIYPFYRLITILTDPFHLFTKDNSQLDVTEVSNLTAEEEREDNAEDIQALIEMGEAEGILEENERQLIETMIEFSETRADEIMTPRTEICSLPIDSTVRAARDLIIEEKYSRMPVYRDSIDNIEGVIYVRDLLNAWADGKEDQTIEDLLRPAFFVPETKSASELLQNMQTSHIQIAIVVDEYGGVAGLVTVEDIIEEIVGEIEDEDIEEEIIEIMEGADKTFYDVIGSTEIGKIERLFDMEIEDDDFTTLAGLVTSEAGYVPKIGDRLNIRGLDVEILQADEKKISLLRLRHPVLETSAEHQENIV